MEANKNYRRLVDKKFRIRTSNIWSNLANSLILKIISYVDINSQKELRIIIKKSNDTTCKLAWNLHLVLYFAWPND